MTAAAPVLYIHPSGHLNDLVVPAGALSCLNAVEAPKLGRYAFEVTDEEIASARIVAMDVHWALAVSGFERLVRHIRSVNRSAAVVVGGVTAGHYASELLARYPVDYVVRGDSETSFAELSRRLLAGERPTDLPNVFVAGRPPPRFERMTPEAFDATDCLTADWFPTYEMVSGWDAAAFPQGRTIPVSRGCAFRCPECYGSYASTYGAGYLLRSPSGLAEKVRRAARMGLRNLRMFVAKPPPGRLTALLEGLAEAGPFRFASTVGLYLCTPPTPKDLELLEAAFENEVAISMIPPEEHVPALKPKQLGLEAGAWIEVARRVARSDRLNLDVWTTHRGDFERTREAIESAARSKRVKVSFGAVWSVTRPTDTGQRHDFETVQEAVRSVWTFYLARLLSPGLSELLAPFRFLDELDVDPASLPRPEGALSGFFDVLMESWGTHCLPNLPGLTFAAVPLDARAAHLADSAHGIDYAGALRLAPPGAFEVPDAGEVVLASFRPDHRGMALEARVTPSKSRFVALLPCPLPSGEITRDWIAAIGRHGLVVLDRGRRRRPDEASLLRVELRAQSAYLFLSEPGQPPVRGRADMGYFRASAPSYSGGVP